MFKSLTIFFICLCGCFLWGDAAGQAGSSPAGINSNRSPAQSIRSVPDSQVSAYRRNPDFAYANDPTYWKEAIPEGPGWSQHIFDFLTGRIFRTVLFISVLLLVLYGIYRLVKENSLTWFARSHQPARDAGSAKEDEAMEESDLDEIIRRQTVVGNYRMATRYMYLKVIRELSEKKPEEFQLSATNADMMRVFQEPEQAGDFRFLARAYEYIYYGGFVPSREQFDLLQDKFNLFHKKLEN
jgi:hypothetical protein